MTPTPQKDPRADEATSAEARLARIAALTSWNRMQRMAEKNRVHIVTVGDDDPTPSPDESEDDTHEG